MRGISDGQLYIMMELVDGTTLREFVAQQGGRLSVPLASGLIRQTASALAYIHSRGIVHRDLNLRNLMVVKDEAVREGWRIKILDFGIAKFLNHQEQKNAQSVPTRHGSLYVSRAVRVGQIRRCKHRHLFAGVDSV